MTKVPYTLYLPYFVQGCWVIYLKLIIDSHFQTYLLINWLYSLLRTVLEFVQGLPMMSLSKYWYKVH